MSENACLCGERDCDYFAMEYPWCRSCADHHRAPECPIDQDGYSISQCGCRWDDLDLGGPGHGPRCAWVDDEPLSHSPRSLNR
jgi:hypothetical protein